MINLMEFRETYAAQIAEFRLPLFSRICTTCKHLALGKDVNRSCSAFPAGIPVEIWNGGNDHTSEYEGDNGYRFETVFVEKPKPFEQDTEAKHKFLSEKKSAENQRKIDRKNKFKLR